MKKISYRRRTRLQNEGMYVLAYRAVFLGPNRNITLITIGSIVTSYTYLLSWLLQSPDSATQSTLAEWGRKGIYVTLNMAWLLVSNGLFK